MISDCSYIHSLFVLLVCLCSSLPSHSCTLHYIAGNIKQFQFPDPSKDELTPCHGIGGLLLPRRDLVKKCCDELMEESQAVSGRNSAVSGYWRGPQGSGKTTFLHLMGREMQDRDCQVFFLENAADFNETDDTFVRSLSENRSEFEDTVVVMIDEVPTGLDKVFWERLLKECQGVIVVGVGVPALPSCSPVHLQERCTAHELCIALKFQSELSELVDALHRHFPENTREQLIPFCKVVNATAGGHVYPTLKLCEHLLQIPDWPDRYEKALWSSDLVSTKAYAAIKRRCYTGTLPTCDTFERVAQLRPTPADIEWFESLGLWDSTHKQLMSPLYNTLLWNTSDFPASTEKIELIIEQGLAGMDPQLFVNPYGSWDNYNPMALMWALNVGERVPRVRVFPSFRPTYVLFTFSGLKDVAAIELLRTGVDTKDQDRAEVEERSLHFGEKDHTAMLIFQLTGDDSDIIVPPEKYNVLNYTFVHELNSLYKGKQLLKRGVVSRLPTPPPRRDFSTWSAARPVVTMTGKRVAEHHHDAGRAALRLGYSLLKRFR
jgi:hypothetical protein